MKNYYEVLGIKKDTNPEDIKKSFRILAVKYHPDKFPDEKEKKEAESKFKEINEAYSVLSDPVKKEQYDNPPPEGFNISGNMEGFEDVLKHFMGRTGFAGFGNPFKRQPQESIQLNGQIILNIQEVFKGSIGKSTEVNIKEYINSGDKQNFDVKTHQVFLNVPPGFPDGQIWKTEVEINGKKETLYLMVRVDYGDWEYHGDGNIITKKFITYPQSILGGKLEVETLNGKKENVKIPEGSHTGLIIQVKNQGLPISPNSKKRGNMMFYLEVSLPEKEQLSAKAKDLLKELQKEFEKTEEDKNKSN